MLFFERSPQPRRRGPRSSGSTTSAPTSTSPSSRTHCAGRDLDEFVDAYLPGKTARDGSRASGCKSFTYDELVARDKVNLDITWLRDESLEDADNLPAPEIIAREIVEDLAAALAEFEAVATALEAGVASE